jgi:hypothetical protein
LLWIAAALFAGLALGAWGPRSDLRKAQHQIRELELRLKESGTGAGRLRSITDMLRIPEGKPRGGESAQPAGTEVEAAPEEAPAAAATSPSNPPPSLASATNRPDGEDLRRRIDEAMDVWRIRADVARNSFVSSAGLNAAAAGTFDVVVAAMNLRLANSISNWVEQVKKNDRMTPEDGARILNDVTSVFVLTYNELDRKLPATWRDGAGDRFDLVTFVDPSVATPLIGIEDALDRARERQR